VFVDAQIGALEAQANAIAAAAERAARDNGSEVPIVPGDPAGSLANELMAKKSQLAALSAKYTDQYPEIRRLKDEIPRLEKRIEEVRRSDASPGSTPGGGTRSLATPNHGSVQAFGARERDEIFRLRAQRASIDSEISALNKDQAGIRKSIADLEARVEKSPRREQEMVALTRDYENLKLSYDDLLKKKLDAEVSQNLEKRQKGEQFQILDPADLPQEPFSPDRKKVFGIALAAALAFGFGGAIGMEMINPALRSKRDFLHYFQIPVLASIPALRDEKYEIRQNRKKAAVYGGLVSFTLALTIFLVVFGHKVRTILLGTF
jgi:succinoglycan biosynthesis transport protein ExoP